MFLGGSPSEAGGMVFLSIVARRRVNIVKEFLWRIKY